MAWVLAVVAGVVVIAVGLFVVGLVTLAVLGAQEMSEGTCDDDY